VSLDHQGGPNAIPGYLQPEAEGRPDGVWGRESRSHSDVRKRPGGCMQADSRRQKRQGIRFSPGSSSRTAAQPTPSLRTPDLQIWRMEMCVCSAPRAIGNECRLGEMAAHGHPRPLRQASSSPSAGDCHLIPLGHSCLCWPQSSHRLP
jgi:hypothetical protein